MSRSAAGVRPRHFLVKHRAHSSPKQLGWSAFERPVELQRWNYGSNNQRAAPQKFCSSMTIRIF